MPIPRTKSVGKVMKFLKKENPSMPKKQKVAIALRSTGKSSKSVQQRKRRGS